MAGIDNKKIASEIYINEEDTTCFSLKKVDNKIKKIPYVFVLGKFENKNDSTTKKVKNILQNYYKEVEAIDLNRLYKLKNLD